MQKWIILSTNTWAPSCVRYCSKHWATEVNKTLEAPVLEVKVKWKSPSRVRLFATPRTIHGILQARTLDWIAFPLLSVQEIFPTQGLNPGLPHCRQILYWVSHQESLRLQQLPDHQYSLNPTNLMELNIWKNVKRKPKFKIYFNRKRAATKKEILKSTKQAITIKINTQESWTWVTWENEEMGTGLNWAA